MKFALISFSIVIVALPALACKQPIIKNGTCPLGYYTSGNYCIPSR
jgi:hypothetical protein